MCYRGLQELKRGYRGLEEIKKGYSWFQGVTGGSKELHWVTRA